VKSEANVTKKEQRAAIIAAGRKHLRAFLNAAKRHGTIYYDVPSVSRSGMSRQIKLWTISKGQLVRAWPGYGDHGTPEISALNYSDVMDVIAKDWGFSFEKRSFVVSGCGMDMVFALIDDLANKAYGWKYKVDYANRVRRDSL
jgi:hypothetical protein